MYHSQRPYEMATPPHAYVNQQPSNLIPFDFNQYSIKLFRDQTELTHSTQWFHQQTTDALEDIAKSSSFQENQQFINDILTLKTKKLQSFDDWLEQINKAASLTNKDPYKIVLAKCQESFTRMISSFSPFMGWNRIKERIHFNFGSVATNQHAVSMLIDQQQKLTETLQEYVQKFQIHSLNPVAYYYIRLEIWLI